MISLAEWTTALLAKNLFIISWHWLIHPLISIFKTFHAVRLVNIFFPLWRFWTCLLVIAKGNVYLVLASSLYCTDTSSVIRQKDESQNGCFKKTKHATIFRKTNISYPLIRKSPMKRSFILYSFNFKMFWHFVSFDKL